MSAEPNARALERIAAAEPVLVGPARAGAALGLAEGELGHAGPPFQSPDEIPPVVLNALCGAIVHEGWAGTLAEAERLLREGQVRLRPNHEIGTVSPMAGVVRPGQSVFRVENRAGTGATYATLAEAGRRALRFGIYDENSAAGLRWLDEELAPALARALPSSGLPLLPILAEAVALGDDLHQRNIGNAAALVRAMPSLERPFASWLFGNPQHALNYAMAAAKLCLDQARGLAGATLVTAISRNGVQCGIQVAGTGDRWFCAPASLPEGDFFPPASGDDAQHDLGDSAIMEAYGLGGAAAHVAPELSRTMGRSWDEAQAAGHAMRALFIGHHPLIAPVLAGQAGIGLGLDARRIVAAQQPIRIHTGIAHRDGQTGWVGVGVATAPVACFAQALAVLDGAP